MLKGRKKDPCKEQEDSPLGMGGKKIKGTDYNQNLNVQVPRPQANRKLYAFLFPESNRPCLASHSKTVS